MEYITLVGSILTAVGSILAVIISNKNNTAILNVKLEALEEKITQKSKDNMNLISVQIDTLEEKLTRKTEDDMRLISVQIDTLDTKVEKHNNVLERMKKTEFSIDNLIDCVKEIKDNCREMQRG